jgi:hypothetical protein
LLVASKSLGAVDLAASGFHKSAEALEALWAVSWIAGRVLAKLQVIPWATDLLRGAVYLFSPFDHGVSLWNARSSNAQNRVWIRRVPP